MVYPFYFLLLFKPEFIDGLISVDGLGKTVPNQWNNRRHGADIGDDTISIVGQLCIHFFLLHNSPDSHISRYVVLSTMREFFLVVVIYPLMN